MPQSPFQRVQVFFELTGGTRVEWTMSSRFLDPLPHTTQLQVSLTSARTADDWEDVGSSMVNSFYALDDAQRMYGKSLEVHYRVKLTTSLGTYYSDSAAITSGIAFRDWLKVREMLRQKSKALKKGDGIQGYLLKARRFGTRCTNCLDALTGEPTNSYCQVCYGTQFLSGYYAAVPDYYLIRELGQDREELDGGQQVSTTKPVVRPGIAVGLPYLNSRDVFVEKNSGLRWFIQSAKENSQWRGYPLEWTLELRQAPFTDNIYNVPLDGTGSSSSSI